MPPPEAPPGAARENGGGFGARRLLVGALLGGAVGLIAHFLDASPWWWLAVPAGMVLAVTSFHFQFAIRWDRK